MNKIVVIVRGGNIQDIMTTEDCEVAIIDWDNIIDGPELTPIEYDKQTGVNENDLDYQVEFANAAIRENVKKENPHVESSIYYF
jgi:hypothetical protein